ncbi:MAG: hypothetical protein ACTTKL_01030 [Treponema sp.]
MLLDTSSGDAVWQRMEDVSAGTTKFMFRGRIENGREVQYRGADGTPPVNGADGTAFTAVSSEDEYKNRFSITPENGGICLGFMRRSLRCGQEG